jgi:hypothetical protein
MLTVTNLADLYDNYPALPASEAAEAMAAFAKAAFFGRLKARRASAQSEKARGGRPKGKART